jgi:hypothetical protein
VRDGTFVSTIDFENANSRGKKIGKHSATAYRILDFVERYAEEGFSNFEGAFSYERVSTRDRIFIDEYMAMRDGLFSYRELFQKLQEKEAKVLKLKEYYKDQKVKEDVNQFVMDTVQDHVQDHIKSLINAN